MSGSRTPVSAADQLLMQRSEVADEVDHWVRERSRLVWIGVAGTVAMGVFAVLADAPVTRPVMAVIWGLLVALGVVYYRECSRQIGGRRQALATLDAFGSGPPPTTRGSDGEGARPTNPEGSGSS